MKIHDKTNYYGLGVVILAYAASNFFVIKNDNSLTQKYDDRIQNMEYIKRNAPQKYIKTLEELSKSKSHKIDPVDINYLWSKTAASVKDSLELTTNK